MIGKKLGRYQIQSLIGEGGMATVYLAEDINLERQVAVKVIRAERVTPEQLPRIMERFKREAKALAKLSDEPGIVTVYDYGEYEGTPYLVMAYMPGGTLKDRLGSPIQYQAAAKMLLPITRALGEAHEQGVIHRDVKPSNLLVDKHGQLALADFGIAKALEVDGQTLTSTGMGVGTPEYMAPEQWRGQASPQTDVYALGVVLYEMLTGEKPFKAENPSDIYLKQMTEDLPDPGRFVGGLPETVAAVLRRAMARQPEDRFASMTAFRGALAALVNGDAGEARSLAMGAAQREGRDVDGNITVDELDTPVPLKQKSRGREAGGKPQEQRSSFMKKIPLWGWLMGIGLVLGLGIAWGMLPQKGENPVVAEIPATATVSAAIPDNTETLAPTRTTAPTQTALPTATFTEIPQAARTALPTNIPTPDGNFLSPQNIGAVQQVSKFKAHDAMINDLDYAPDGLVFASGSDDGKVRIWDVKTLDLVIEIDEKSGAITSIDFSPDGKLLAAGTRDHWVVVWDRATWEQVDLFDHGDRVQYVEFFPTNQQLATVGFSADVKIWDLKTQSIVEEFSLVYTGTGRYSSYFQFTPEYFDLSLDGEVWAAGSSIQRNSKTKIFEDYESNSSVHFSNDGKKIAVTYRQCAGGYPVADGLYLQCTTEDSGIQIWDVDDEKKIDEFVLGQYDNSSRVLWKNFSFTPDDRMLVATSSNVIKIVDIQKFELLATFEPGGSQIMSTEFSPSGDVFITADYTGNIAVWGLTQ